MKNDRGTYDKIRTYAFLKLCEVVVYICLFFYPRMFFGGDIVISDTVLLLRGASLILAIHLLFSLLADIPFKNAPEDKDRDK